MITTRKQIEDRIRQQVTDLKQVAGAAFVGNVAQNRITPPAAFVLEVSAGAKPNQIMTQTVVQSTQETYAVIVVVKNQTNSRGADSADQCRGLRDKIIQSLLGWSPGGDMGPITYGAGQIFQDFFEDGLLGWRDLFVTHGTLRSQ